MDKADQIAGDLQFLCLLVEFVLPHGYDFSDLLIHLSHMSDCLHHVAGTRFPFCTDHGRPLTDSAQCFAQIPCAAYERHFKFCFVDMINIICRGEHFAFIDVVDFDSF